MSAALELPAEFAAEAREILAEAQAARIRLARRHPAHFCEYVLRDERTGAPIELAPMHREWHALLSAEKRVIIWSHVEAGKTSQLAIGRPLWEIGKDRNKRIVLAGNTQGQAAKSLSSISKYIERSAPVHDVFPDLKPGALWTKTALTVDREAFSKDPSIQAIGVHGQVIGGRIDWLLVDDILDFENTRSKDMCDALIAWYRSEIVGRLTAESQVAFIGNAYVPHDLLHVLASEGVYKTRTYSVMNDNGQPRWPEAWPPERIAKVTKELGGEGHPEVARQLYCVPRSEGSSRCQEAWIQQCLARGEGIELLDGLTIEELVEFGTKQGAARVHVGADLGIKRHKRAGKSVVFGILVWPGLRDRQVVTLKSGRWPAATTAANILDARERFNAMAHVEDVGAQDLMLQALHGQFGQGIGDVGNVLTVLPFHTGGNKTHPVFGVESIFVELARGEWIIPSRPTADGKKLEGATEEIREWIAEMLAYSPERHTGDHLMAAWFAKEGARLFGAGKQEAVVTVVGDEGDIARAGGSHEVAARLEGWDNLLKRKPQT